MDCPLQPTSHSTSCVVHKVQVQVNMQGSRNIRTNCTFQLWQVVWHCRHTMESCSHRTASQANVGRQAVAVDHAKTSVVQAREQARYLTLPQLISTHECKKVLKGRRAEIWVCTSILSGEQEQHNLKQKVPDKRSCIQNQQGNKKRYAAVL